MLYDFFRLNGEANATIGSGEEMVALLQQQHIENAIYEPDEFHPRPFFKIQGKRFFNVSFSRTHFFWIEFRKCSFEDCLFLGTEFERCELHECNFKCCNFHKSRFIDTYVDPQIFIGLFHPRDHTNIGVHVFQQLRSNAMNTHQPEFFQTADWQFRLWRRRELRWELRKKKKSLRQVVRPIVLNFVYELFVGYGHSLRRFVGWSACAFILIVWFNCWWFRSGMHIPKDAETVNGTARTIYYTLVTLTTLGYGDITPVTQGGMLVAGLEALLGLVWFGMLTSIIVKKVFR